MKHVVSVSLGSSKRSVHVETEILGQRVLLERRATDGDMKEAAAIIRELDGKVDAIGLGGLDIYLYVGGRRYVFRDGFSLAANAKKTPVVCGAGLKDSLERQVVKELEGAVGWRGKRVLMVLGVDRFGMAEALDEAGADVLYGDAIFALHLPLPLRSLNALQRVAKLLLPAAVKLPITWIYPVGKAQESSKKGWGERYFSWAEVIVGDFHYVRRYAPERLDGKVVLTNTTTTDDVEMLRSKGVKTLITTTPRFGGRSLATNLLEAAFVAIAGRFPLGRADYQKMIREAQLKPDVLELN